MKPLLTTLILLLYINILTSQNDSLVKVRRNTITAKVLSKNNSESKNANNQNNIWNATLNESGRISDVVNVSLSGALDYNIPINVPVGIKGMEPKLSISYNSQAGNGQVGWGWNISGVSTISRVSTTLAHDGFIDPVDFDENDRFSIDGQRLIAVDGIYGNNETIYKTENFSNLKIISYGNCGASFGVNSPCSFKVYYPDGKISWYGISSNSRNELEWALTETKDPQGNFIKYDYDKTFGNSNVLTIREVSYGANNQTFNTILFDYTNKNRKEVFYVGGRKFIRAHNINKVTVKAGQNNEQFRKYLVDYDLNSLGYERVIKIGEINELNEMFSPINFTYPEINNLPLLTRHSTIPGISPMINAVEHDVVNGDFDGDGKIDFISYKKDNKTKYNLFYDLLNNSNNTSSNYEISTSGFFKKILATNILTHNNKLIHKQAITVVKNRIDNNIGKMTFSHSFLQSYGVSHQYTKEINVPTYTNNYSGGGSEVKLKPTTEVTGDFNGDGITDVILITKAYHQAWTNTYPCRTNNDQNKIPDPNPIEDPCDPSEENCYNTCSSSGTILLPGRDAYFIDLNKNNTGHPSLSSISHEIDANDRLLVGDFNGDGKSNLFHFKNAWVYIYGLDENNRLQLLFSRNSGNINLEHSILLGDFNGDNKADIALPVGNDTYTWEFLMSNGNSFTGHYKNIGIHYKKTHQSNLYLQHPDGNWYDTLMQNEYFYLVTDLNKDGKSDILFHHTNSPYYYMNIYSIDRVVTFENTNLDQNGLPGFNITSDISQNTPGNRKYGIPIIVNNFDYGANDTKSQYALITRGRVDAFNINRDNTKEMTLETIVNDGITTEIIQNKLINDVGNTNQFYTQSLVQNYPYTNINLAPSFNIVTELIRTGSGVTQKQNYRYTGAVSHIYGYGFLGFENTSKTNWWGVNVSPLWTNSTFDMSKRGALVSENVSTQPFFNSSSFVNKTDYTYNTQTTPEGVFINIPTQIVKNDGLKGVITTENYTYDNFYNPLTVSSNFPGGSNNITYEYLNNSSPASYLYHIGRPSIKIELNTLGSESFGKTTEFTYNNNLVTQTKIKGIGTDWLTESFTHDIFGNITQKTISATGMTPRVELFEYDSSGRFLTKSTDIEGLESVFTYNNSDGDLLSETTPYGLTTTFQYDGWNRPTANTNYLGKTTTITYGKETVDGLPVYTKLTNYPEGQDEKIYVNLFGWTVKSQVKGLNNKWIVKSVDYDLSGKKTRESEPYFSNETPSQWNTYYYDSYNRPISTTLFNGNIITTSYNGLSITVDDGTKTMTKTQNAIGNTLIMQDMGGTVNYEYFADGTMKTANYGSHVVSTTIDGWGRKTSLTDPSAGNYTYEYNIFGETLRETTPKGETNYTYDNYGNILSKTIIGDETNLSLNYVYDNTTKLVTQINGLDSSNNTNYNYLHTYDTYQRMQGVKEVTATAIFEKQLTYDDFGRINTETYNTLATGTGTASNVTVSNIYDSNGIPAEIRDTATNNILWQIGTENAKGQTLTATYGNGYQVNNAYDSYGYLTNVTHQHNTTSIKSLDLDYNFNAQRGILNSRTNNNFTNWTENFLHDDLDRLIQISGATQNTKSYDDSGRISNNSNVGFYNYENNNKYRLENIDLNNQGDLYYQQHKLQQITYNAFKKPVEIFEEAKGRVSFEYGPMMNRTHAYYGGLQEDKTLRQYHKQYSSIIPVEITFDAINNSTKINTFIGGDTYSANIVHSKQASASGENEDFYYLHRDYLGSILAITNSTADIVEQRQFGAWGTTDKFIDNAGNSTFGYDSLLNRGFTGHEHFFSVGLLHMNGRMYDANLGRFLSPDNYIQDPYNTQSFNRYGYVWNNPLSFNDPSGEFLVAALIGAAVSVIANGINNSLNGQPFFRGAGFSALYGAVGGVISFGIGSAAASFTSNALGQAAFQAVGHAYVGGVMATDGNFGAGMLSGLASSVIGSAVSNVSINSNFWSATVKIGSSGVAGGLGSVIADGNFLNGFRQGVIVGGLNHYAHSSTFALNVAMAAKTGEFRHVLGPDAEAITGGFTVVPGVGATMSKGYIKMLRGSMKGDFVDNLGLKLGVPTISGEVTVTRLYYSGSLQTMDFSVFTGQYAQVEVGFNFLISIGAEVSISPSNSGTTYGVGFSIGYGWAPTIIEGNFEMGTTGSYNPFKNKK